MPPSLSQVQKDTAVALLRDRTPQNDVAIAANCSIPQVKKIASNLRAFGTPDAPKLKVQGRPRSLSQEMLEVPFYAIFCNAFC